MPHTRIVVDKLVPRSLHPDCRTVGVAAKLGLAIVDQANYDKGRKETLKMLDLPGLMIATKIQNWL